LAISLLKEILAMTRIIHTVSAILLTLCACKQSGNTSAAADIVLGIIADLTDATADAGKPEK
jgi:hypothetical protein